MKYYHVSRYVKEGLVLKRETKNNYCYCEYIDNCDVSTSEKLLECYKYLCKIQAFKVTDRKESKWCCEALFEYIRKIEFLDKPSRIWGVYLSATLDDAYSFLSKHRKPIIGENGEQLIGHIYRIYIPEYVKVSEFDMAIYTEADEYLQKSLEADSFNKATYEFVCNKAREYWSGVMSNSPQEEYLVDCDVTIGDRIL